ncbi:MAG: hypothetical protein AB4426_30740 [Xenococcaceae cyanobacterium]
MTNQNIYKISFIYEGAIADYNDRLLAHLRPGYFEVASTDFEQIIRFEVNQPWAYYI